MPGSFSAQPCASGPAREIADLVALRTSIVQQGNALARPSRYWLDFIEKFSYVTDLGPQSLERLRYHTYHLTSDNYQRYYFGSSEDRDKLTKRYVALAAAIGARDLAEPMTGIGYPHDEGLVSWDLLRYMSVACDLLSAQAVHEDSTVLEIGGGYGGLCRVMLRRFPGIAYNIVDLEEVLFFSKCYLEANLPDVEIALVRRAEDLVVRPGRINLIPQCLLETLHCRFELAINQQSMQEMEIGQVRRYLNFIAASAKRFYARNLRRHDPRIAIQKGLCIDIHSEILATFRRVRWKAEAIPAEVDILDDHLLRVVVEKAGGETIARSAQTQPVSALENVTEEAIHQGDMVEVLPIEPGAQLSLQIDPGCCAVTVFAATWGSVVGRVEIEYTMSCGSNRPLRRNIVALDVQDWQEVMLDLRGVEGQGQATNVDIDFVDVRGGRLGLPLFSPAYTGRRRLRLSSPAREPAVVPGGRLIAGG